MAGSVTARVSRGVRTVPPRIRACGTSPAATSAGSAAQDAAVPSTSASTIRAGYSDCAERISPQTAACARSAGSSPGPPATAPVVVTTRVDSEPSHRCSAARTRWVAAWVRAARPIGSRSGSTASGAQSSSRTAASSLAVSGKPVSRAVPSAAQPSGAGTGSTRCSAQSTPYIEGVAGTGRSAVTVRMASAPTVTTGAPAPSAAWSATRSVPAGVSLTRSVVAPTACRVTSVKENAIRAVASAPASATPCRAASSRAGWMPKRAA